MRVLRGSALDVLEKSLKTYGFHKTKHKISHVNVLTGAPKNYLLFYNLDAIIKAL